MHPDGTPCRNDRSTCDASDRQSAIAFFLRHGRHADEVKPTDSGLAPANPTHPPYAGIDEEICRRIVERASEYEGRMAVLVGSLAQEAQRRSTEPWDSTLAYAQMQAAAALLRITEMLGHSTIRRVPHVE